MSYFADRKKNKRLTFRGQGLVHIYICLHMFAGTHTHTHVYHPHRPLCYLADGAGVVSFNDGEASPGEACLSSILSGVSANSATPSWHQCRAEKRQSGSFELQWWAEKSAKVVGSVWIALSLHLRNSSPENTYEREMDSNITLKSADVLLSWGKIPQNVLVCRWSVPMFFCSNG